jgi:hypothetical protein
MQHTRPDSRQAAAGTLSTRIDALVATVIIHPKGKRGDPDTEITGRLARLPGAMPGDQQALLVFRRSQSNP